MQYEICKTNRCYKMSSHFHGKIFSHSPQILNFRVTFKSTVRFWVKVMFWVMARFRVRIRFWVS